MMKLKTAAVDTIAVIVNERGNDYGPVKENFARITMLWNSYIQAKYGVSSLCGRLDAGDVANMMILLKMAREMHKHKADNMDDIAGYAKCHNMLFEVE